MILTVTPNPCIDRVYFVDEFEMGEVHRPHRFTCSAGGKGLNVSRVAHLMGHKTLAMGFVGGFNGEFIKSEITKQGVENKFTQIDGETRICINISDKNGLSGEILESGPFVTEEEKKAFLLAFESEIDSADIVCAAGSLPKGLDSSFYIELIRIAKKHGKRIVTDASGKTLDDVIKAQPFMVKPNRYELSLLMGKEIDSIADVKEALTFLQKSGVELPLATLGKDGAMAYIDGKFYKFSSPEVEVINTVGSGDSSVSGIAVGLSRGMSIIDSVKLGMAAGTANTQSPETGFVTKELVEKYYKEIIVDTI